MRKNKREPVRTDIDIFLFTPIMIQFRGDERVDLLERFAQSNEHGCSTDFVE
jgi:hypothetical protein